MSEIYPIGADAINVDIANGNNLEGILPRYYNNVNLMKSDSTLTEGAIVLTLGYYIPNDGGKGLYKIVDGSYTDDGGSYHLLNNGLFAELIVKDEINVDQFGAKGDNYTNSTSSIQNAVNFASNKKIILKIPAKSYRIETINLSSYSTIIGASRTRSILKRISSFNTDNYGDYYRTGYILGYYPNDNTRINDIVLKNFTIDGIKDSLTYTNITYQTNATTNNIYIRLCDYLTIDNLIIRNSSKSGINIKASNQVNIINCECYSNGLSLNNIDANGLTLTGNYWRDDTQQKVIYLCKNINIKNNILHNNEDEGLTYCNCNDIIIDNNKIYENGDRGIEGDSTDFTKDSTKLNVQIINNFVDNNGTNGITEYSKASNINYICSNNIIRNVSDIAIGIGIDSDDIANIIISNNVIENCNSQPFNISATDINFIGNVLKNISSHGSLMARNSLLCDSNSFINNTITENIIYAKSNNIISFNNNIFINYLKNITLQRYSSDVTKIENVMISNNLITNLINLISVGNNIENLKIDNNICSDTRNSVLFQSILSISDGNTVTNCNITNNNDSKALYSLNITKITNLRRVNNSKDIYMNLSTRYTPSASATYQRKGDIAFNTNMTSGNPVGWIFDGTEWKSFGTIL